MQSKRGKTATAFVLEAVGGREGGRKKLRPVATNNNPIKEPGTVGRQRPLELKGGHVSGGPVEEERNKKK